MPYKGIPQAILDTRYINVTGDTMIGPLKVDVNSATALVVEQNGVKDNTLVVDTTTGRVGIGMALPGYRLDVMGAYFNVGADQADDTGRTDNANKIGVLSAPHYDTDEEAVTIFQAQCYINDNIVQFGGGVGTQNAANQTYFYGAPNNTTLSGTALLIIFGYGHVWFNQSYVGIGVSGPQAPLHVDQSSTTAAVPAAIFDQADVSEEIFEFVSTIGVGNAIEAVGVKTLTTTHFIKVTLPGGLTRYIPAGTIA